VRDLRENLVDDGKRGPTVIGPQAVVVGEISGDEDLLVEGRLEGKVRTDRKVTIGGTGDVRGDVLARSVVVAGKVEGQILAQERAELLASAEVKGSIQAPKVVIAEGAKLQGNVAMSVPAAAAPAASKQSL
jgi:cytoskeletal protein CcmA (bactofilin family)